MPCKCHFVKTNTYLFLASCTDLIPNLKNATLSCTSCFHVLSVVLLQNQKFVFRSVCVKGVFVTSGISKQFISHTK